MNYRPVTIIFAALFTGGIAAIVTPRFTPTGEISWLISIAVAVLAGAAVAFATHQRVDES